MTGMKNFFTSMSDGVEGKLLCVGSKDCRSQCASKVCAYVKENVMKASYQSRQTCFLYPLEIDAYVTSRRYESYNR